MLRETTVENGRVRGIPGADPRVTIYRGIPFAAPPVGENRWRAPQPAADWEGVLDASRFGPISYQNTPGTGTGLYDREWHVDPEIPMSEDSLYLNIWTPAKRTDEKLPVLVWFFGGGFQWGYTAEMEFDGERLARRGIIVVSVGYRLNVFGFLAHPAITAESPDAPSNFGLLDQQAGLHWVYRNIAAFGGDPERITISGQSAGGASTMHQFANKDNFSIVKGAIVLSGMIRMPKEADDLFRPLNLSQAEKRGEEFFELLGVSSLAEARAIDSRTLLAKYDEFASSHPRMFPIMDGKFCTEDPMERIIRGECAQGPLLSGNTSDEFLAEGESVVERSVKSTYLEAKQNGFAPNLYYYRFDPEVPGDWTGEMPGTFHSCDLWFFFETLGKCHRPYSGRAFELARQMCDYVANFVKTGDPNGTGWDAEPLPAWRPYLASDPAEMNFGADGARLRTQGGLRLGITGKKQAVNPYLPSWEYIPDGEPYVFGDRVYVYGSHDIYGGETFCLGDYVCWSAPVSDLGNWHYEGVIYPKTSDPFNPDGHMCLYAPDVTQGPDGRYYLYYVLDKVNVVSVAVCDSPAGRFEFLGYVHYPDGTRLGEKEGDEPQFDPGVLTEGNETYLFTGFCGHGDRSRHGAMFTTLEADMLTVKTAPVIVVPGACYSEGTGYEGHAFFEAPSIRKKDGLYYFIYSSQVMHELCFATSKAPAGPYTYGGVLVSNCDLHIGTYKDPEVPSAAGANNHGSMEQIGDSWYIFYHRHTNGTWYSRQGCAEKLSFDETGLPLQAEITSCGLNGGPLSDEGEYPAYIACNLYTPERNIYVKGDAPRIVQEGGDEGRKPAYIKAITEGTVIGFKSFDLQEVTGIRLWTRAYFHGAFELRTSPEGPVIAKIPGESANIWTANAAHFDALSGVHALYLTYRGTGTPSLRSFELLHSS